MKLRHFLTIVLLAVVSMASAQQMPKLPLDEKTRIGKLDNGLTYYIRHNEFPEHTANFYIAQRVGSIQEEDSQRGLAHFLEHMAFNGSTHFKGNGIIEFTRSLGVAFGRDLNAYTSIEQTVYNIDNVPTTRETALDSCLLVLQDWSNGLELAGEEIDKERGVIHGEWAMRNSAMQRLIEKNLPAMYPNCKYGYRLPIGTMEVVDNFTYDELRNYYKKWYHPENQAIIVVGDVDVDHMEAKIKELFGDIKAGPEAAHVVPVEVPDNQEAIYIVDKDKEMQYSTMFIMLKSDAMPREMKNTQMEYLQKYLEVIIAQMFNSRMNEISQDPNCPFVNISLNFGDYLLSSTKDAADITIVAKEGKEREAYATAVRELRRAKEFGFTGSEFVRAKEEFLSVVEKEYANRDKRKHTEYYKQCVDNFLKGDAMPNADIDYQIVNAIAQQLPLEIINQTAKEAITIDADKNLVTCCFSQEKEGANYMTVEDMKNIMAEGRTAQLEAWVDNTKDEPLMANEPKAGTIKKETKNEALGYTELQLSNGAKVILKKTDFKDNEIVLSGYALGGEALYGEKDYGNLRVFDGVTGTFGLGNFSNNELEKALAGKQCNVDINLNSRYNTVSGHSTPKDVETMMQLLHLYFTAPAKDEKAYGKMMQSLETMLKNRDLQPETQLSDSIVANMYSHNPRFANLTVDDLKNVSLDRIMQITKERFSNANNFTFTFVGNFDEATIRPLICKYIASLPGKEKAQNPEDVRTLFKGDVDCQFTRKMETPKPYIVQVFNSPASGSLEDQVLMDYVGDVLSMMLLKSVREDAGAAYSVGASGSVIRSAIKNHDVNLMQIYAPISAPEKVDLALDLMAKDVKALSESADADMVSKVKANYLKQADVDAKNNNHWVGVIENYTRLGVDTQTRYKEVVESVTPAQIAAFLKNVLLSAGNHLKVVMRPE